MSVLLPNRYDTPQNRWRRIHNMVGGGWACRVDRCECVVWQDAFPDGVCPACCRTPVKKGFAHFDPERDEKPNLRRAPQDEYTYFGGLFDGDRF
jgi:hypothetical protein